MYKNILLVTCLLFIFSCSSTNNETQQTKLNKNDNPLKANFLNETTITGTEPLNTLVYLNKACTIKVTLSKLTNNKLYTTKIKPISLNCLSNNEYLLNEDTINTLYTNSLTFKKDEQIIFNTNKDNIKNIQLTKTIYKTDPKLIELCGTQYQFTQHNKNNKKEESKYNSKECNEYTLNMVNSLESTIEKIHKTMSGNDMNEIFNNDYFEYLSHYMDNIKFLKRKMFNTNNHQ